MRVARAHTLIRNGVFIECPSWVGSLEIPEDGSICPCFRCHFLFLLGSPRFLCAAFPLGRVPHPRLSRLPLALPRPSPLTLSARLGPGKRLSPPAPSTTQTLWRQKRKKAPPCLRIASKHTRHNSHMKSHTQCAHAGKRQARRVHPRAPGRPLRQRRFRRPFGRDTLAMCLRGKAGLAAFQTLRPAPPTRSLQNHQVSPATCLTRRRKGEGGGRGARSGGERHGGGERSVPHARALRGSPAGGSPDDGIRDLRQRGPPPARSHCGKLRWRISKKPGRDPSSGRCELPFPTPAETETGTRWRRKEETLKPLGTPLSIGISSKVHPRRALPQSAGWQGARGLQRDAVLGGVGWWLYCMDFPLFVSL